MDKAKDDPGVLRPPGAGSDTMGPGSAVGETGASDLRERRKPRIEVLRGAPPEAAEPAMAPAREPRIEVLAGGARASPQPRSPGIAPGEPEQVQVPARRRRGGLLNSRIPMLALLALLVLVALYGYASSGGGSDSEVGDTEAAGSEDTESLAEPERDYQPPPAPEPRVERPAAQAAPVERPSSPEPSDAPAARAPEPADAEVAADPEVATPIEENSAVATVRAFYGALSAGDGAAAAQWVVPAKRRSGPLSAGALGRYFSSFRRRLRLRRVTPVDADTVRVAYDYVLADGRLCQGQASVDVVPSGDRTLIGRIRTQGPC